MQVCQRAPRQGMETSDETEHISDKGFREICGFPDQYGQTEHERARKGNGMTRGRPPRQAIREAKAIAEKLGTIVEIPCSSGSPADLMIFCTHVTFYIRVKRTRSHISDIADIVGKYKKELLFLCTIPLTDVAIRELWVRSPRGSWQYFRLLKDGIMEIRNDGHYDRTSADFEQSAWPPNPETEFTRDPQSSRDPKKGQGSPDRKGWDLPPFSLIP